jgi:hypothetical protein
MKVSISSIFLVTYWNSIGIGIWGGGGGGGQKIFKNWQPKKTKKF